MSLRDDFQHLIQAVRATDEGRAALLRNAQTQQVVFDVPGGQGFTLRLTAQSPELIVTPDVPAYRRFHTTIAQMDAAILRALIDGDLLFSEAFLRGEITVRGSVTIKQLLARLFRIGYELKEHRHVG